MKRLLLPFSLLLLLTVAGCPLKGLDPSNPAGDAISRATARNESITYHVDTAKPHSDSLGKVSLDSADKELTSQKSDLLDAQKSLDTERKTHATDIAAREKLQAKWYVRYGQRIEAAWRLLVWSIVIGIVLRVLSQTVFASGPVGTALAFASTGIFGVLTGGVSIIQSIFDHNWHRIKDGGNGVAVSQGTV